MPLKEIRLYLERDWLTLYLKDTWYLWCQNSKNQQLIDILACYSANKPSFQNPTKGILKDGSLAESQARVSRCCRFLLFWHHNYQVSLKFTYGPTSDTNTVNILVSRGEPAARYSHFFQTLWIQSDQLLAFIHPDWFVLVFGIHM